MKMRPITGLIDQSDREYADAHANQYDAVIGVCHNPCRHPDITDIPYLHRAVRDEDTPTQENIEAWANFGVDYVRRDRRVLVHCEAGQNRSAIVGALIAAVASRAEAQSGRSSWELIVNRLHEEFLQCDPPHNWMPYEHWRKPIEEWLKVGYCPRIVIDHERNTININGKVELSIELLEEFSGMLFHKHESGAVIALPTKLQKESHPETFCERCLAPNMVWHANSQLWNKVMRDAGGNESPYGIVCPQCFATLAKAKGIDPPSWRLIIPKEKK